MTNTVKEDLKFAGQLSLCGESLKLAVQIYADMLDSGYQPTNYTEIMKNHAAVIQAHSELGKM